MTDWAAHVTVATVIERDGRYLLVEERDKSSGDLVFNQPAGHLEAGESLQQAAVRETLEETGWHIRLCGVLGLALYQRPDALVSYHRTTFVGEALDREPNATLDSDIDQIHWLHYEEIQALSARMRSPLVIAAIDLYRQGHCYPLDMIYSA